MARRKKRSAFSDVNNLDFLEELSPFPDESPFKRALKQYFDDPSFVRSQKELKEEMKKLKKALSKMDEAKMAYDMMAETKKRLTSSYHDLLEKKKVES